LLLFHQTTLAKAMFDKFNYCQANILNKIETSTIR